MARTKAVGKKKATSNGDVKHTAATSPPGLKTSTQQSQQVELTDDQRAELKVFLENNAFNVKTIPTSSKRKRGASAGVANVQADLFEERLSVQYEVSQSKQWTQLRKYKKFTVGAESIALGQCILVQHDEDPDQARIDLHAQWKAKVLEIRALDQEHVYIRVAWLNRPEDLPEGRKSYHGRNELIPTNQMDIIDALAVNGSLDLVYWNEHDDEAPMAAEDQFCWRQTYDFANTKTFSELRQICVDSTPQNPDEMILQCGLESCRKWLHVKCIAEHAVREAAKESANNRGGASKSVSLKKARPKVGIPADSKAQARAELDSCAAEVFIRGLPKAEGIEAAATSEIVVVDEAGGRRVRPVSCLACGGEIDD